MPTFEFTYRLVETRKCRIEADTESAARQAWIDGDTDFDESVDVDSATVIKMVEL